MYDCVLEKWINNAFILCQPYFKAFHIVVFSTPIPVLTSFVHLDFHIEVPFTPHCAGSHPPLLCGTGISVTLLT